MPTTHETAHRPPDFFIAPHSASLSKALARFTQQGPKLVGTLAVGHPQQGYSVALSAGRRASLCSGPKDDCKHGGWLNFIGPPGPFTNQGQCLSHFAKLE
jgi:hypothetical protein